MRRKNLKFKIIALAVVIITIVFFATNIKAAENKVNYNGQVVVDSDLDGLTDQAEIQIYKTNPGNPDTDGDGYYDGAEVIAGTDPLNIESSAAKTSASVQNNFSSETPWAWYVARASGIIGFIFLWFTIFLGLAIRNPILKKFVTPLYSFSFHCFLAATAVFWSLIHGTSLLFDKSINFGLADIAIPFFSKTTFVNTNYLALGIMAFYAMVIMTITSYLKKHLNHKLWRILHFLNPLAFVFVVFHGYVNGTDMKNIYIGSAFIFSSIFLALIYVSSLIFSITNKFKKQTEVSEVYNENNNEHINQN